MTAEDIIKRFKFLQDDRRKWESDWKEAATLVNRGRIWLEDSDTSGKHPEKIFDSTAVEALNIFADGLLGQAISPSAKFFKLKMLKEDANRVPYAQDWLEGAEDAVYSALNASNFYSSIGEFLRDGASIGTAIMLLEDDVETGKITFTTRHPKECYIAENRFGQVDTMFRRFRPTVREVAQTFKENNLPDELKRLDKEKPYERVIIIHAVFPREDIVEPGTSKAKKKYASYYIYEKTSEIIAEGGYDSFPYIVWRYMKNTDEVYGRGIATESLPEILRANQMAKTLIAAAELRVNPPMAIPQELKGRENLNPRGRNYYNTMMGRVEPIEMGSNLPYGWNELQMQQNDIRKRFYADFFLLLETMSQKNMTATEVMELQAEKAAILGAMTGRLNTECLTPLIDRVFQIERKKGNIPDPPPGLSGYADIEFLGPLAQAQRRFGIDQGIGMTTSLLNTLIDIEAKAAQSNVIDNFDLDELAYQGAQVFGCPQKVIREEPEIKEIRKMKAQAIAAAQQQQMLMQQEQILAQNADKLNKPVQPDSMIERATKGVV